jgi:hypothetical protein
MTASKSCGFERPQHSALEKLAPELLHFILGYLPLKDVLTLRRTCINLSSAGLDYFGTEVPLVSHYDKFRALKEIAKHSVLSKRMKSLFYVCDRPHAISDRVWKDTWSAIQIRRGISESHDPPSAPSFRSYLELCETYASVEHQEHERNCFRELFQGCPNMREITLACQAACSRRLNASRTAFDEVMVKPDETYSWENSGVLQLINLAHAAATSNLQLDSLTLAGIGYLLWNPRNSEQVSVVKALIQPLRRLRLSTLSMTESEDRLMSAIIANEATANFQGGRFREMLAVATNLRVLKLHFSPFTFAGERATYQQDYLGAREIYLKNVIGDLRFPHLYELAISSCGTTSSYLEEVLLRHKDTLRRLTLSHIHMVTEDFRQFFRNIAGQLPELRKVTLHGITDPEPWGPPGRKSTGAKEFYDNSLVKYEVENFVLSGGVPPQWQNRFTWVGRQVIVTQKEDYLQSGLPEDNTMPDDPKLDYTWDEFDDRF